MSVVITVIPTPRASPSKLIGPEIKRVVEAAFVKILEAMSKDLFKSEKFKDKVRKALNKISLQNQQSQSR